MSTLVRSTLLWATATCWVVAGCVPVPAGDRPMYGGQRPEQKIGHSSHHLVRPRHSTRDRVVAVLGPPDEVTLDGRIVVYEYPVIGAWLLWLVPFAIIPLPQHHTRHLRLTFDQTGVLQSHRVYLDRHALYDDIGRGRAADYQSFRRQVGAAAGEIPLPPIKVTGSEVEAR